MHAITKIDKKDIENMQAIRQSEITLAAPHIERQDFASDAEYREALLKNYQALRQKEYELTVQNECLKVYNLAEDAAAKDIGENVGVWNGYRSYINAPRISPAEKERRKQQVENCAIARSPELGSICMNNSRTGFVGKNFSCAITASSITAQVSAKMGYDREENLIQAKYRGKNPSLRNNLVTAQGVANCDSIPNQYRGKPTEAPVKKAPKLNTLIANGTLGAGDVFSIKTRRGANSSTGYHAMTIAAVEKDKDGKIIGYTLQANNRRRFISYGINESNPYTSAPMGNYVQTHNWIKDKITEESKGLENLSTAELEAKVAEQRAQTLGITNELQESESYAAQNNYCTDMAGKYIENVNRKKNLIKPNMEELKKSLAEQIAVTQNGAMEDHIKNNHFNDRVDEHKKPANDDKRPVREAMREDKNEADRRLAAVKSKPAEENAASANTPANTEAKREPETAKEISLRSLLEASRARLEGLRTAGANKTPEHQPQTEVPSVPLKNIISAFKKQQGR